MARVLSWKLDDYKYGYLYIPGSSEHLSNRITDEATISLMVDEVGSWDEAKYKKAFDEMNVEIKQRYSVGLAYDSSYYTNSSLGSNVVILTGKDGSSSGVGGGNTGGGGSGSGELSESVYDELNSYIDGELAKVEERFNKSNEAVKSYLEAKVTDTISQAKSIVSETSEELNNVRTDMEKKLGDATDAMNKAADLFNLTGEGINADTIKSVFSATSEYSEWLDKYGEKLNVISADYDEAGNMGQIGGGEDASKGMLTKFAQSLNVISGTVGNVEKSVNASLGQISDIATWYDTNASSVTEASRFISASGGQITDLIDYVNGSGLTNQVERAIDAQKGLILDEVKSMDNDTVTAMTRKMDSMNATIQDQITTLSPKKDLTDLGNKMNAISASMETWITKTDENMAATNDLRDTWDIASGKLSTVSTMVAETDTFGNIIYYVSAGTPESKTEIIVHKENGKTDASGNPYWFDANGNRYENSKVYVHYGSTLDSYIQQQASAVTIAVTDNKERMAGIMLGLLDESESDGSYLNMIADKIAIKGDVIMGAMSAKTADIGGIEIGDGRIQTTKTGKDGNPMFKLDGNDGSLLASNANIRGVINADSGSIGGLEIVDKSLQYTNASGETTFKVDGNTGGFSASNAYVKGEINATSGTFAGTLKMPFQQIEPDSTGVITYEFGMPNSIMLLNSNHQKPILKLGAYLSADSRLNGIMLNVYCFDNAGLSEGEAWEIQGYIRCMHKETATTIFNAGRIYPKYNRGAFFQFLNVGGSWDLINYTGDAEFEKYV